MRWHRVTLAEAKRRPSSLAHIAAAQINLYEGRHDLALTDAARAIALDPNDPEAHIVMACGHDPYRQTGDRAGIHSHGDAARPQLSRATTP